MVDIENQRIEAEHLAGLASILSDAIRDGGKSTEYFVGAARILEDRLHEHARALLVMQNSD